jgi:type IV pilus assembly protein PilQ
MTMRNLLSCLLLIVLSASSVAQDEPSDKITLNVRDTSLGQVIELISVQQSVNIVAGVDTNLPVTVNFFDASLEEALDWVLGPLGLGWYYDGKVYTILEAAQIDLIKRPLVERIFYPNYRSAAEMQTYLVKFLSAFGSIVISEAPEVGILTGTDNSGGVSSTLQEMLIVMDNEDALQRIERVFRELDKRPRQVLVEATMVQVILDETNRFGVDFQILGNADFLDFESILAPQLVFSDPTVRVPGQLGTAGVAAGAPFITPKSTKSITQTGFTDGPGAGGMRIGFVGQDVAVFLEALQSTVDTNVLANTELLALNKMKAEIIIGGRLGYLGGTTVSNGISQQTVEFLEVGTQLRFRPFIGNDGFVRLEIHPERSQGIVDPNTGLPSENTSEVSTNVMVRDGETVVIGGLIQTTDSQSVSRVPFLGYLPLIGWLFSKEITEVERTEIIIMITPHILEDGEAYEDGKLIIDDAKTNGELFVDGFGPVARRTQAKRSMDEALEAFDKGNLSEARALCNRVIALDPLADGVVQLSLEIDARMADKRALESAANGGE